MKKHTLFAVALILAVASPAFAEGSHLDGKEIAAKHMEHMKEELSLTDAQAAQIESIMESQRQKMEAMREEIDTQINPILTPEQKEKFEAMKKEFKSRKKEGSWKHKGESKSS